METGLPFVALWSEVRSTGEVVLHLLNREMHLTVSLPEVGTSSKAVEEFLPELAQAMPSPDLHTRWLLLLEPSLPASWFATRWESLNLAGRTLSSQALVVRHAVWGNEPASDGNPAWLLNIFPTDDYRFLERFQPLIQSGILRSCRKNSLDLTGGAEDLFVMAHGRAHGLVEANDVLYVLPQIHPTPRRIWLLACNVDAVLDAVAKSLLKCGCETVIAATSELSAPAMAQLVEDWFLTGRESDSVASWLARTRDSTYGDGDVRALTIWGGIDIDRTPCTRWNRLTWDDEHGEFCRPPLDDETTRESFHEAFQQGRSHQAWPLTRKWMTPPLLWLAEKHHHPAMAKLSEEIGDTNSPEAIRSLAAAARRVGNYVQTAKYLSLGLNLPDLPVKERADYLGALANLFIDLDLPESAAAAIELHEDCSLDNLNDRNEADFRRLDWLSRMEARRGRLDLALDHMTAKRKRAIPDEGRELAWQLYLSTWGSIAGQVSADVANVFAAEVTKRLSNVTPQDVGYGNETTAYLLRALSLHSWAVNNPDEGKFVARWLHEAEGRISNEDPGPWAYIIVYLHLQGGASVQCLDRAISALERARYYLEASFLAGFALYEIDSCRLLNRFHRRRKDILAELSEKLGVSIADALTEAGGRQKIETNFSPESVARYGTLPL
jgi:hypothetical protein